MYWLGQCSGATVTDSFLSLFKLCFNLTMKSPVTGAGCTSVERMLQEEEKAILEAFKPFFEDPDIRKVWHNYSFDRHVMMRMVGGRHLAYSVCPAAVAETCLSSSLLCCQALPESGCWHLQGINCQGFHADTMHMARLWNSSRTIGKGYSLEVPPVHPCASFMMLSS